MTAQQTDATTDPQSIIAALQQRLDAGLAREAALAEELAAQTAELTERKSEFGERIAQQAATIDVLKVMSASPGDPQPVFDLIVERACACCGVETVALSLLDGDLLRLNATSGMTAARTQEFATAYPLPVSRAFAGGRAILMRDTVQVPDTQVDPDFAQRGTNAWHRSVLAVPLLRAGMPMGAIGLGRSTPGAFSAAQVELLKTFAEQAVIAISSAETYRALQTRTTDLQESLEYQTATSDVLKVISRSTFDLQPVLDTLLATAARLCRADLGTMSQREGDAFRVAASYSLSPEYADFFRGRLQPIERGSVTGRTALEGRIIHVPDLMSDPDFALTQVIKRPETVLGVPLLRDAVVAGVIVLVRQHVQPFTDQQIELVRTFADQAVIAIENMRLITEQREALERQTATAEVLQVINASPGNLAPVFDAILEKAHTLCGAPLGSLVLCDGEQLRAVATRGYPQEYETLARQGFSPIPPFKLLVSGELFVHVPDTATWPGAVPMEEDDLMRRAAIEIARIRTALFVPLRKSTTVLGYISAQRQEKRPFTDKQIALLQNFAAQAVIAMENARLITEQREALEQQTATAEVLQVINASPGNLTPVFDAMLEKAMRLCGAAFGSLYTYDGERFHSAAQHGVPPAYAAFREKNPPLPTQGGGPATLLDTRRPLHVLDLRAQETYRPDNPGVQAMVDLGGIRTILSVPLVKDDTFLGNISIYRQEVRAFSDKQISLLQNFAAQAVIAMENARLLDEIHRRQEELRITFENMGDGVAMFDETPRLVAWNRRFQDILDVPDEAMEERRTFDEYIRYLTERGEFGPNADPDEQVLRLQAMRGEAVVFERTRPNGRIIEVRQNPVPGGGFVLIYADITERKLNEAEIRAARDNAEATLRELKAAQANLIQAEKMASLGQLTAGIAHEIKNPLNFVNNFAALSAELIGELREVLAPRPLRDTVRAEVDDLTALLKGNLEKVVQHGQRADGIVKAMLEHSRGSSAERRMVDLNAAIDEALNLGYHGARAQDQSFNITLERDFGEGIAPIEVNPQDMTRVFLNLFSNGFYATTRRARDGWDAGFAPTLKVTTRDAGEVVEIRVRDNGTGIPAEIRDKLFQPFFTTKPTGEGTGLGLSITYDIVTKQHGGTITVDSEVGAFTEFFITLPRQMFANGGGRA